MVPFFKHKVRFSGLLAWLMWRTVYLSKLPGRERKLRVIVDWVMETLFPRDIVQTIAARSSELRGRFSVGTSLRFHLVDTWSLDLDARPAWHRPYLDPCSGR
jgi:hypothetical protein